VQDFVPWLKNHLLARLLKIDYNGDETDFKPEERNSFIFVNNRIYRHKVFRVNYTTYDLQREQDSLNPRTHADIMLLSHEDEESAHPYWYARIIGVFHATVQFKGLSSHPEIEPGLCQMEFLWVRWFGWDPTHRGGWKSKRLHRVGFVDGKDPDAFGFLDPKNVVRGVHLIPAFAYGHTNSLLQPSVARAPSEQDRDWMYFYVNM
jgi:hypothetical protein